MQTDTLQAPGKGAAAGVGAARFHADRRAEAEALLEERDGRLTLRAEVAHFGCPYCRSTEGRDHAGALGADRVGYVYRDCAGCGLAYPWPRLNAEILRWRATSPAMNQYLERSFASEPAMVAPPYPVAFFRGLAGKDVLEVGPGAGRLLRFLRATGARAVGVEPNPVAARFCGASGCRTLAEFYEGDLVTRGLLAPASFDAVIFFESLPHLFDVKAALELTRALLRPGGRLVVKAFDVESVHLRYFVPASRGIDGLGIPVNGSPRTYRRILEGEGFAVRRIYRQPGSLMDQAGFHWPAVGRRGLRRALRGLDMVVDAGLRLLGHSRNFVLVAEKV